MHSHSGYSFHRIRDRRRKLQREIWSFVVVIAISITLWTNDSSHKISTSWDEAHFVSFGLKITDYDDSHRSENPLWIIDTTKSIALSHLLESRRGSKNSSQKRCESSHQAWFAKIQSQDKIHTNERNIKQESTDIQNCHTIHMSSNILPHVFCMSGKVVKHCHWHFPY